MPNRDEKETNLLTKFASVVVEKTRKVSDADIAYCERLQIQYTESVLKMDKWYEALTKLKEDFGTPEYIYLDTHRNNIRYISENGILKQDMLNVNPFATCVFEADSSLLFIEKKIEEGEQTFARCVVNYFNKTYNLKIDSSGIAFRDLKTKKYIKKVHYLEIIDFIIEECGGLDSANLTSIGIENLKSNIRRTIYKQSSIKVSKDKLTFDDWLSYDKNWAGQDRLYHKSYERLVNLTNALRYFDDGSISTSSKDGLNLQDNYFIDNNKLYKMEGIDKVKHIKFYKNGKIEIAFTHVGSAQEFYNLFELFKNK